MGAETLAKLMRTDTPKPEADPAADGLAGVMAKSASVAALSELNIQLEAHSRKARQTAPESFIESLPENGLYFIIECAAESQFGLLAIDPVLFDSIADVLTGDLDEPTDAVTRNPTAIDIALSRPYFDALLEEFGSILRDLRAGKFTDTYHTGAIEKEPSPHLFPETPYLEIVIDFDFANGARNGRLSAMLPAINTDFITSMARSGDNAAIWKTAFGKSLDNAAAKLDVVLYRKQMQIGKIMQLKAGDMLELPALALESLSIESGNGASRRSMMRARLGEYQEMRAAKITQIGAEDRSADQSKLIGHTPTEDPATG